MTSTTRSLADLFSVAGNPAVAERLASVDLSSVSGRVTSSAGPTVWSHTLSDLSDALPDLLDVEIGSVLAGAWKTNSELARYTNADHYDPNETILVELTTHVVTSQHHPSVEFLVNDEPCGRVVFTVELALRLEGAVLTIRGGRICKASTGTCTAAGRIVCGGQTVSERTTAPLEVPGGITFEPPVDIVAAAAGWEDAPLA